MITGPGDLPELAPQPTVTALAIGVFDGVHLGHQAVVRSLSGKVAALTFEPHPLAVIAPERAPGRLTTLEQKAALLRGLGAEAIVAVRFDAALRDRTPEEFVGEIARIFPNLREVAIGEAWSFGRHRAGNAARLAELARPRGFAVRPIPPVLYEGQPVSSTRVREAIARRDFAEATLLLGRSHAVTGTVIHGEARGRTLGFPTANLGDVPQLLPPRGVYAVRVRVGDESQHHAAVMNLGQRPTFTSNGTDSLEVHLLDFQGDLYGCELELTDFTWLRDEMIFSSGEALRVQIAEDVVSTRRLS